MTFLTSTSPDITEGIPSSLSARTIAVIDATRKYRCDILVNELGFLLDPDGPRTGNHGPYIRQTVPVQKQQFDTSKDAGEQSLDGYWIRSQASWHKGAGINYYEPGSEEQTAYRFAESSGFDVWTPGRVVPLHAMANVQAATGPVYVNPAGDNTVVYLSDTAVLGWDGTSYTLNTPPADINGRYYFFGFKNYFKVGWTSPASATVGVWNGNTNTVIAKNATVEPQLWYCKDRLIVAHGANLFEVPPLTPAASPIDLSASASALHSPQDQNTVWLGVVEGPAAIYAAHKGGIVRFTLQDASSGSTPKLSQGYRVLELPAGEQIKGLYSYLGRFLVLSTTEGIRVAAIGSQGDLTMGQVFIDASLGDFKYMSASGDIVYIAGAYVPRHGTLGTGNLAGWATATGLLAVNLGQVVNPDTLEFAWAMDERSDQTAAATSVYASGSNKYLGINGVGVFKTNTAYVSGGYLAMGRIRFNTLVQKVYSSLDLTGAIGADSTLRIDILDESDNSITNSTMSAATGVAGSITIPRDKTYAYVRPVGTFTWGSGDPVALTLIQLRALPSPRRMRRIRYPLRCHDIEQDRNSQQFGWPADKARPGFAAERLFALEEMEESGVPVTVKDERTGEQFVATIDSIEYDAMHGPDHGEDNFGGVIALTVTKLT